MKRPRQYGAALLAAMLTVSLVATFATAALWNQWRSVEVEAADRTRVQATWILTGALDWSRLILREDARSGGADHLAEPWAVPLQEARLSTFLAADPSNTMDNDGDTTFLSGEIVDMQSLLNVANLRDPNGGLSQADLLAFGRMFDLLGLPQSQLTRMAENLRFASDSNAGNLSGGQAPLLPQRVEQLTWLGLPPQTIATLRPYVTILPDRTPVNLNTAPAEVIYAVGSALGMADAKRLVAVRESQHFRSVVDASRQVPAGAFASGTVDVRSRFFEVRGRLRMDNVVIEERSLVRRDARGDVRTVQREHGGFQSAFAPQATPAR